MKVNNLAYRNNPVIKFIYLFKDVMAEIIRLEDQDKQNKGK